ncbi:unnamed protein product (macronuclear) [Paramecium tetraurelia]|uniref:RING-type E3 ubiquitin transferase n=1 Tax=Paramecium tetraurelia TaxID=5888 RepID=A0BTI1_PARTE|nr:uncharacterized protein GSPATT00032080001 [Paramecium tetraurelia]CAK61848.1 unnamed protein product [Paramecium tetraurelia]|eukprot:XP_001429246.1 hypothetical protein (macronuclear) [Paramecium tetraurelia strain d4-2]
MHWLTILELHSIVAYFYYTKLYHSLNNIEIVLEIAESLNHAIQFEEGHFQPQPQGNQPFEFVVTSNQDPNIFMSLEETERRQMILTEQIKSEVAQRTRTIRCVHYFNALMNQILIIWAFYIEMIKEPLDACYNNLATFQRMFLIISLYQYWEGYVLCLILLISLPFILLMILWNKLKQQKQNYENQQILNELITKQKAIYRNDNVQGDQECGICLQAYCRNEELLILPCNQQHHFHMHCIKAWLILNFSCPKCRSKISEFRNA